MADKMTILTDSPTTSQAAQDTATGLSSEVLMPVGKLDADNYQAEDLDGVTESLFGSGNLNYLALQARQTDSLIMTNRHESNTTGDMALSLKEHSPFARSTPGLSAGDVETNIDNGTQATVISTNGSAPAISYTPFSADKLGTSAHALAGDAFATLTAAINGANGLDGVGNIGLNGTDGRGKDGNAGLGGNNGNNGNGGNNGNNGLNGKDGVSPELPPDPPGPTPDVDLSEDNTLGLPGLGLNLDPIEDIVGDIDIGIGQSHDASGITLNVNAVVANIPLIDITLSPAIPGVTDHLFPVADAILDVVTTENLTHDSINTIGATVDTLIDQTGLNLPSIADTLAPIANIVAPVTDALSPLTDTLLGDDDLNGLLQGPVDLLGSITGPLGLDLQPVLEELSPLTGQIAPTIDTLINATNLTGIVNDPIGGINDLLADTGIQVPDVFAPLSPVIGAVTDLSNVGALVEDPAGTVTNLVETILPDTPLITDPLNMVLNTVDGAVGLGNVTQGVMDIVSDVITTTTTVTEGLEDITTNLTDLSAGIPDLQETIGAVTDIGGLIQDPHGTVSDIISTLPNTDIVNAVADTVTGIVSDPGNIPETLENTLGSVTDIENVIHDPAGTLTEVVGSLPGGDALSTITETIGNILNNVTQTVQDVVATIINIGGGAQDPHDTVTQAVENTHSIVEDTVTNVTDTLTDIFHPSGDVDLYVHNDIGLPQIDLNLDPVENLVGNIDIGVTAAVCEPSLDLHAIVADIPVVSAVISPETLTTAANSILEQLTSITNTAQGATELLSSPSNTTGGIDSLLGQINQAAATVWPETATSGISPDIGSALGNITSGNTDVGSILPVPIGNISEGLGLLNTGSDHGHTSSGGGSHHFGFHSLFG